MRIGAKDLHMSQGERVVYMVLPVAGISIVVFFSSSFGQIRVRFRIKAHPCKRLRAGGRC